MAAFPAERIAFVLAAAIAVLFTAVMVVHRHPIKSVLAVVVAFFALAIGFVLLQAPFIAAIQVIVYAGAILVLFLFVLMLLNVDREKPGARRPVQTLLGGISIVVFAAILLSLLRRDGAAAASGSVAAARGEIAPLARLLFSDFLLPFEALSVLLLAALVGAFVLARREGP